MKHPHAEVIKAWADGKAIEFRSYESLPWTLLKTQEESKVCPEFRKDHEYRIKPDEVVDYSLVYSNGQTDNNFHNNFEIMKAYYKGSVNQGFLKRTRVDGKVVSFEFIPK